MKPTKREKRTLIKNLAVRKVLYGGILMESCVEGKHGVEKEDKVKRKNMSTANQTFSTNYELRQKTQKLVFCYRMNESAHVLFEYKL